MLRPRSLISANLLSARRSARGYSLLTVLVLLTLLGVAVSGLLFFITQSTQTTGAMIERRRTFYACDGMSRQLIGFTQAYLATNTREDVDEVDLRNKLIERLPTIIPEGFTVDTTSGGGLVVPVRALPNPVPVETITSGPFAGIQAKLQNIDIALQATKTATGAVCRTEQSISLGKIALFQFFVFADLPLLDIAPRVADEATFLRGRIHTNGRVCLGANDAMVLDSRVTAVDAVFHTSDPRCSGFAPRDAVIFGPAGPRELENNRDSGCPARDCGGGWRSFSVAQWGGRVQDREHSVPELTLPVSPQVIFAPLGHRADGAAIEQAMSISTGRPNTRFLVEPETDNDPTDFADNKLARKAQIRILDGVWYLKDPGRSLTDDNDDGPWPGIPIWSDHPGSFSLSNEFTAEGVDGVRAAPRLVGQTDIRQMLETDDRFTQSRWSLRDDIGASPTPRRFSYYAYVDEAQSTAISTNRLRPVGPGLQYGRTQSTFPSGESVAVMHDIDPPAVVSYGSVTSFAVRPGQSYTLPAVRSVVDDFSSPLRLNRPSGDTGWCGADSEARDQRDVLFAAPLLPVLGFSDGRPIFADFPANGSPLPSDSGRVRYSGSPQNSVGICAADNDVPLRRRSRLALLDGTRSGFHDANVVDRLDPQAQGDFLPINIDIHALQEALADKTPGELGSFFCAAECLWPQFEGTIFVSNSWRGSMPPLAPGRNQIATPIPSPRVGDDAVPLSVEGGARQPHFSRVMGGSTASLPFPLCSDDLEGQRFLDADESTGASFEFPYENAGAPYARGIAGEPTTFRIQRCSGHAITGAVGAAANVRPSVVRLINARTVNFNGSKCGPNRNQPCYPELSRQAVGKLSTGLSLISNLPLYLVGDVNQTSEVDAVQTGQRATDWIPFMVGADTVTTLSNSWTDEGAQWGVSTQIPQASPTRYHALLLTGITNNGAFTGSLERDARIAPVGPSSAGLLGAMRLVEDWSNEDEVHTFRGSIVLGWNPVYTKWRIPNVGFSTYKPPRRRDWQFDEHLNATVNQPPDTPVFDVSAIRSWRRE